MFFSGHAIRCDARIFQDVTSCTHKNNHNITKTMQTNIRGKDMEKNLFCKKNGKKIFQQPFPPGSSTARGTIPFKPHTPCPLSRGEGDVDIPPVAFLCGTLCLLRVSLCKKKRNDTAFHGEDTEENIILQKM
jgi:hypothetical protein